MSYATRDQVELELRQLAGVVLVTFDERDHTTVVELTVDGEADRESLVEEARRLAGLGIEGPVQVDVVEGVADCLMPGASQHASSRLRVQLLAVLPAGDGRLEVHLAHRGRRVAVSCDPGDRVAVAWAVLRGLGELGLPTPFEPASVHLLASELGDGALVVLRDRRLGVVRRGLASGNRVEEAVARAVLNGLNRYLQGETGPAGAATTALP